MQSLKESSLFSRQILVKIHPFLKTPDIIVLHAAFIRFIIDFWSRHIDLSSRTDITGTLYHIGYGIPKTNPKADERGMQIANEFYQLAKSWLV